MGRFNTGPGHFLSFLSKVLLYLKWRSPPEDFLEMTTFVKCFCSFTLSYGVRNLFSYEMSFFGSLAPIIWITTYNRRECQPESTLSGAYKRMVGGYCHRTKYIHSSVLPHNTANNINGREVLKKLWHLICHTGGKRGSGRLRSGFCHTQKIITAL